MTWTDAEGKGGNGDLSSASSKGFGFFFFSEITAFKLWTHLEVTANMCRLWFWRKRDEIHMQGRQCRPCPDSVTLEAIGDKLEVEQELPRSKRDVHPSLPSPLEELGNYS